MLGSSNRRRLSSRTVSSSSLMDASNKVRVAVIISTKTRNIEDSVSILTMQIACVVRA